MGGKRVRDDELFIERYGARHRARRETCTNCGTAFVTYQSHKSCSLTCARTQKLTDRFWPKVGKADGAECWQWAGMCDKFGYGVLGASRHHGAAKAHRVSWELHNGPIPAGRWVLHHCDNPPCVRPDHLYLGDAADNARDRAGRGRGRENNQHGAVNPNAKLTETDVRRIIAALQTESQVKVAQRFGIKQPQVSRIARRESWSHLWE